MQQNPISQGMPPMPQKKAGSMWVGVVVVIVVVAALLWWQFGMGDDAIVDDGALNTVPTEVSPEVPLGTLEDTTPVINQELQSIDTGDLEKEFQGIDNDMKNL